MKIEYTDEFVKSFNRAIWRERLNPINPAYYYRLARNFIMTGVRGYRPSDAWNAHEAIARVVLAHLDHNETCIMRGYPPGLTEKKWGQYKQEIRWLMHEMSGLEETPVEVRTSDAYEKRLAKAKKIFGEYWPALWC